MSLKAADVPSPQENITMHPYWITMNRHIGVGITARSEVDALQLFELAFGSTEKVVSIEIIKDMNDLDQNHVVPILAEPLVPARHLVSAGPGAHRRLGQCVAASET